MKFRLELRALWVELIASLGFEGVEILLEVFDAGRFFEGRLVVAHGESDDDHGSRPQDLNLLLVVAEFVNDPRLEGRDRLVDGDREQDNEPEHIPRSFHGPPEG